MLKVAIPATAVLVAVPTIVPPVLTVIVITSTALVFVLPAASRIATIGCVVKAAPLAAPAAFVVSASCVAVPAPSAMVCVAEVRLEPEAFLTLVARRSGSACGSERLRRH